MTYRELFENNKEGKVFRTEQYLYFLKEKVQPSHGRVVTVNIQWVIYSPWLTRTIPAPQEQRNVPALQHSESYPFFFGSCSLTVNKENKEGSRFDGKQGTG